MATVTTQVKEVSGGQNRFPSTSDTLGAESGGDIGLFSGSVARAAAGTGSLWADANVTSITIGGGASQTTMTLGKSGQTATFLGNVTVDGNLTVSGSTTTLDVTNLTVEDDVILLAKGASTGNEAGIAVERGSTGDDALIAWIETVTRFELGTFDTTAGTTAPTGTLTNFSDLKLNNLLLDGTAITADGALTVTATSAVLSLDGTTIETSATAITADAALTVTATGASVDLTLGARSSTITLNESGDTSLDAAFTATSIVGGLNEVKTNAINQRLMTFATFGIVTTDGIQADTQVPSLAGDFQIYERVTSTAASGQADIYYEGRLKDNETTITEIEIPIKGSGTSPRYQIFVYVEGSGSSNVYTASAITAAPASRTVTTITDSGLSAQPTGEKRYYVKVEALVDDGENVYVGRPLVTQE
jgi:hypothetical protein